MKSRSNSIRGNQQGLEYDTKHTVQQISLRVKRIQRWSRPTVTCAIPDIQVCTIRILNYMLFNCFTVHFNSQNLFYTNQCTSFIQYLLRDHPQGVCCFLVEVTELPQGTQLRNTICMLPHNHNKSMTT